MKRVLIVFEESWQIFLSSRIPTTALAVLLATALAKRLAKPIASHPSA